MPPARQWIVLAMFAWNAVPSVRAEGAAELKLSKDFLAGVLGKLPPCPFEKTDQYRGNVHSFRLNSIEPLEKASGRVRD